MCLHVITSLDGNLFKSDIGRMKPYFIINPYNIYISIYKSILKSRTSRKSGSIIAIRLRWDITSKSATYLFDQFGFLNGSVVRGGERNRTRH